MAIQKMTLVNLNGPLDMLDDTILSCSDLGCFHPKDITPSGNVNTSFSELEYKNPYAELLQKVMGIASSAGIDLQFRNLEDVTLDRAAATEFIGGFYERYAELRRQADEIKGEVDTHADALVYLKHLQVMNISFDQIFGSQFLKVRFGRLPKDSERKLALYQNKIYQFFSFDTDQSYIWGAYLTTLEYVDEIDNIFASLFFERVRVPDYVHGTPQLAIDSLQKQYELENERLQKLLSRIKNLVDANRQKLLHYYCQIRFLHSTFELRRYVGVSGNKFYMVGFIPKSDEKRFLERFSAYETVQCDLLPEDTDKRFVAPTKLRNNRFCEPFEMFVRMYGMPSRQDIDPTPYLATVYTLLFGIMFGDMGQGLLLVLVGYLAFKFKGMELGRIVMRIGCSSAVFGFLYGSVFGFEHLLDPIWRLMGFHEKPIEIMDPDMITKLLIGAIVMGVVIITVSISMNIVTGFRHKDLSRAVLSQNGIAGLVFYLTLLLGVLGVVTGMAFFNPLTVSLGILLPLVLIFFKEPLFHMIQGGGFHLEGGVGGFIAESLFELFEVVLSFLTNTMSFLRVGGFILSHAGMMAVVFTLSEMVGAGAAPVVIIIGNLFVVCLEGLIVGIQVLRLQFYEMFSRFFIGEGEPFEPISVDMAIEL